MPFPHSHQEGYLIASLWTTCPKTVNETLQFISNIHARVVHQQLVCCHLHSPQLHLKKPWSTPQQALPTPVPSPLHAGHSLDSGS